MAFGHFRCFSRASSPQFDVETYSSDLSSLVSDNGSESDFESDNESQEVVCTKTRRCRHINDLPLEVIAHIRDYLNDSEDLRQFMRVQRSWYTLGVRKLWAKPAVITPARLDRLGDVLSCVTGEDGTGPPPLVGNLADHVRRLNFCHVSPHVKNAELLKFQRCRNLERLVLQNCQRVEPLALEKLLRNLPALVSVDLQIMPQITDSVIDVLTSTAQDLQVFYGGGIDLSNASIAMFQRVKSTLRRFRLSYSPQVALNRILDLVSECVNLAELDLSTLDRNLELAESVEDSRRQGLEPRDLKQILLRCPHLRELRLDKMVAQHPHLTNFSVLNTISADNLRVLTLASSPHLDDSVLECILPAVPKLRHLNISKCPLISDRSLVLIAQAYNHGLHYLHLGHCYRITDRGVEAISELCDRLTYFDAANCARLTNRTLGLLGKLPRLRRIGLVKCNDITGVGLLAFTSQALASVRSDTPTATTSLPSSRLAANATNLDATHLDPLDYEESASTSSSVPDLPYRVPLSTRSGSISLERLHLSYCSNISIESVRNLLRVCPRLLHLSLTGVRAFMRSDVLRLSRPPPSELHENQRQLFCVFSGQGIAELRRFLQALERYEQAQLLRPPPSNPPTSVPIPPPNISQVLSLLEELDEVGNSVRDTIIWSGGFSDVDDRADAPASGTATVSSTLPQSRINTIPTAPPPLEERARLRAARRRLPRPPETRSQRLMSIISETRDRFTRPAPVPHPLNIQSTHSPAEPPSSVSETSETLVASPSPATSSPPPTVAEPAPNDANSPGIAMLTSDHLWPEITAWPNELPANRIANEPASYYETPNFENPNFENPNYENPNFENPNFENSNYENSNYELPSRTASLSPVDASQSSSNHSSSTHLAENSLNERELADLLAVLRLRRVAEPETVRENASSPRRRRFSRL